jgi:L-glyceraldehyde 3-phosphate reductase
MSSSAPSASVYTPDPQRYERLAYRRCGMHGLQLGAVSLGLWHNFGDVDRLETMRRTLRCAFDLGVTHFDLANNYGPPPGSAEANLGRLLREDFAAHRDELILSTKAGYRMGPGPYGDGGSRKYLVASLDQSLRRLGVDYVDIYYHHRPDPQTPLEETMSALADLVRCGKALYIGLSNYPAERLREAAALLRQHGTPCVLHQPRYNLLDRAAEDALLPALADEGIGCIAFSPLAQGLLTDRYRHAQIPADSRIAKGVGFLRPEDLQPARLAAIERLAGAAQARGLSLAQLAVQWVLSQPQMTSVLIGASRPEQVQEAVAAAAGPLPDTAERAAIAALVQLSMP